MGEYLTKKRETTVEERKELIPLEGIERLTRISGTQLSAKQEIRHIPPTVVYRYRKNAQCFRMEKHSAEAIVLYDMNARP
jgi:hypothetical protein